MRQKLYILFGLLALFSLLVMLWWYQAKKAVNPLGKSAVSFKVKRGETVRSIATRLKNHGLIRSPVAFFLLARITDFDSKIQAGDFQLSPAMDLFTITNSLTHGTSDVWITIPEGLRTEEIAQKLAKKLNIPESEFLKHAKEGYMFPDTYLLPKESSASGVVKMFLANFNKKITPNITSKAKEKGLSLNELIIIASLVEREAKFDRDRPLVASVILNRLKIGMKLHIDATIQYALGYQPKEKSWWKKSLTLQDLDIDSPYNTYKYAYLPPGPISNPGIAAIKAVAQAPDTDYLYYLSDNTGKTYFAKTLKEHNKNIRKYLN